MLYPGIFTALTEDMGYGVFTSDDIDADTVIEISPVIVMSGEERKLLDKTRLHDYIFEWGAKKDQCCMAMGYVPIYNHSYKSNCEYEMDFENDRIIIRRSEERRVGKEGRDR